MWAPKSKVPGPDRAAESWIVSVVRGFRFLLILLLLNQQKLLEAYVQNRFDLLIAGSFTLKQIYTF